MSRYLIVIVDKDENVRTNNFYDREEEAIAALKSLLVDHHVVYYGVVKVDGCHPTRILEYIH